MREPLARPPRSATGDPALDRRVVVVEDEPRLREMLLRAIAEMDFTPAGAATAEAALRELEERPCGILLIDLNLPRMGGLELCEAARARWPGTPVIILTGYGTLDAARRAIRLDVVDFLTKPCPLGELEVALDRALRRRQKQSALHGPAPAAAPPVAPASACGAPAVNLSEVERQHIMAALQRHGGNRALAAAELGISVRTLYYRLRDYGPSLEPHGAVQPPPYTRR